MNEFKRALCRHRSPFTVSQRRLSNLPAAVAKSMNLPGSGWWQIAHLPVAGIFNWLPRGEQTLFINFCFQNLLKTATECCRTERKIQRDAWGSVHTARVAQQCLHANCPQYYD